MSEIKCPYDLNQFILGEPIFENPFPEEECEKRKYYGDCYHCFSTAIAARDHQLKTSITPQPKMGRWIKNAEKWQNVDPPYICSECGRASLRQENFCCSCGADMRGDADADSD